MGNEALLHPCLASAFYGSFRKLQSIQESAIPPLLEGRNLIISARTGSGKTEAVLAPLLSRHLAAANQSDSVTILYIAPTKALVNDLERRLFHPLGQIGLRLGIRHGDRDDLRVGLPPHVLITTPESLDVMLFRRDSALTSIRAVVVDEIHLIYNTQRGLHLSVLLHRLRQDLAQPLQWAALSATIGSLRHVRDFLFGPQEEAEFIQDSTRREIDAQIRFPRSLQDLRDLFVRLLEPTHGKFLVFANSRRQCEELAETLASDDFLAPFVFVHYSSLSAETREEVEKSYNQSPRGICIATSTLELGIDIGDIDAVFLYGSPSGVESFLQRIGRGNRRSNKTNVVCVVCPDSPRPNLEALVFHALIELGREGRLPCREPYGLFGAAAQQALSYVGSLEGQFIRTADLAGVCDHLPHLQRRALEPILAALAEQDYLRAHGFKNRYGAGQKLYDLIDYRMIYGNFPMNSQEVTVFQGKKVLGQIPQVNLLRIRAGDVIRFAGKKWQVRRATGEGIKVDVPRGRGQPVDILYPGGGMGLDGFVLSAVWDVLHQQQFEFELYAPADRGRIQALVRSIQELTPRDSVPFCRRQDDHMYLTFAGNLINKAIALITNQPNFRAEDAILTCPTRIDWNSIPIVPEAYEPVFGHLFQSAAEQTFYQTLLPVQLQRAEFLQMWFHDPTIRIQLQRLRASTPHEVLPEQMESWGLY
jgi:ATP-dependent Lhr-like helicase